MDLADFEFELPDDRIAAAPAAERDLARLMVLDRRGDGPPAHRVFRDLPDLLRPGDVLVLNETAVFPARLLGTRSRTGGKVEVLLLSDEGGGAWEALVRSKGTLAAGESLAIGEGDAAFTLVFEAATGAGRARVRFPGGGRDRALIAAAGRTPLPPYIPRARAALAREPADRERYQTVYAREPGAVAAPTAGLHFTRELLAAVEARGVTVARLVLHVGLGTFAPVRVARVEEHAMHHERYSIPEATREAVLAARRDGRRVVAIGTTSVRALETWARTGAAEGTTDIFLYPGATFRLVDALVTNFHLPRSTLLLLVAAFAGRERVLAAYAEAIGAGYRFYSYGDAMLIA